MKNILKNKRYWFKVCLLNLFIFSARRYAECGCATVGPIHSPSKVSGS